MRIGFEAKRAFNNNTGLGNYSRFVVEALLKYTPKNDYLVYTPKIGNINWAINLKKLVVRLPARKSMKSLWRSYFITNDLLKDDIQIFHGLSNEIPFGRFPASIKTVVTIHDLIFERYPTLYPFFDRLVYRLKFKYACKKADKIIAVSEQTKQDIVDFYHTNPDKIAVIYQDCDEAFRKKIAIATVNDVKKHYHLKKQYILCVSTITERKNQLNLVKAFHQLKLANYELVLVGGKSGYQKQVEDYLNTHKLTTVKILNKVPFNDLPALYQGAALFVYPSVFEGFGIPIVEALHAGVPVVAATGSCLEEAGGDGALYADPLDINDLAQKMQLILTNIPLQQSLVEAGKKHLTQFSAENIAKQLTELYENLL